MRVIRIKVTSNEEFRKLFEGIAEEMGFVFLDNAATIDESASMILWQAKEPNSIANLSFNYQIEIVNEVIKFVDYDNNKTIEEKIDRKTLRDRIKRLILDEESLTYIGKTKKQISGNQHKMKRIKKLEGFLYHNIIKVENPEKNSITIGNGRMINSKITVYGVDNILMIEDGFFISNMELLIRGNGNRVHIGKQFELNYNTNHGPLYLSAKDNDNNIDLGNNIHVRGSAEIVCMEGTSLLIGDNFGMSNETIIRTGDGHRIIDHDGRRSNPSKSIIIGSNCWLARRGIILKGVELQDYTIVGTAALVTKKYDEGNIVLGGNPAKIIKREVTWLPGR